MKFPILILLFLNIVCSGQAEHDKWPKLQISLSIVEAKKESRTILVSLDNLDSYPVRVIVPKFHHYAYGSTTSVGGYRLLFLGPDGKPANIDWGTPPPEAVPGPPTEKDTVVLSPGMGISLRVPLTGELVDPKKVSSITAQYVVHGPTKDGYKVTGGSSILVGLGDPALWQGGIFNSAPLVISK